MAFADKNADGAGKSKASKEKGGKGKGPKSGSFQNWWAG